MASQRPGNGTLLVLGMTFVTLVTAITVSRTSVFRGQAGGDIVICGCTCTDLDADVCAEQNRPIFPYTLEDPVNSCISWCSANSSSSSSGISASLPGSSSSSSGIGSCDGSTTVLMVTGDKDGFGIQQPIGVQYEDINAFIPGAADPDAMDRILVANSWGGPLSDLPMFVTSEHAGKALPFQIVSLLPPGAEVQSAMLSMVTADIDEGAKQGGIDDRLFIDGQEIADAFSTTDQYAPGVTGKSGMVKFTLNAQLVQTALADGQMTVLVDEPTRNGQVMTSTVNPQPEVFAIDFAELQVSYSCPGSSSSSSSAASSTSSSSGQSSSSSSVCAGCQQQCSDPGQPYCDFANQPTCASTEAICGDLGGGTILSGSPTCNAQGNVVCASGAPACEPTQQCTDCLQNSCSSSSASPSSSSSSSSATSSSSSSRAPFCGNGWTEGTEQCDDGNLQNGDCCSSSCQIEQGCMCTNSGLSPGSGAGSSGNSSGGQSTGCSDPDINDPTRATTVDCPDPADSLSDACDPNNLDIVKEASGSPPMYTVLGCPIGSQCSDGACVMVEGWTIPAQYAGRCVATDGGFNLGVNGHLVRNGNIDDDPPESCSALTNTASEVWCTGGLLQNINEFPILTKQGATAYCPPGTACQNGVCQ